MATKNTTKLGHPFHLGTVTHRMHFENDALVYDVVGEGEGKSPRINNLVGTLLFRPGVKEVVRKFKDPPRVRSRAMDIDIYP